MDPCRLLASHLHATDASFRAAPVSGTCHKVVIPAPSSTTEVREYADTKGRTAITGIPQELTKTVELTPRLLSHDR